METTEPKTTHYYTVNDTAPVRTSPRNINATKSPSNKKSKSGGSKKEPNKKDPIEANIDRYHKVNTQISKTDNLLKKLTSQEEKLVGKNLIENLNKQ